MQLSNYDGDGPDPTAPHSDWLFLAEAESDLGVSEDSALPSQNTTPAAR